MQEDVGGRPGVVFNAGATRAGGAAGEGPKQHQAKEGKQFFWVISFLLLHCIQVSDIITEYFLFHFVFIRGS